jgi:hypothetical protein
MVTYLEKITGQRIVIVDDGNVPDDRTIVAIGRSTLTASIDTSGLGCEQFVTDIQAQRLTIVGGHREAKPGQAARDAGTLYGVYEWNHMYRYLLPVEEYFGSHPEYFALKDGQPIRSDLCLGHPELPKRFAKKLIAKAQANPELTTRSVEPDDCLGHTCQCELCKAMDLPANRRPNGEGSNRIARFSNTIAGEVAKDAPWVKLMWLGYLPYDILMNFMNAHQPEAEGLKDF